MNATAATVLFAAIVASLIAMPATAPQPRTATVVQAKADRVAAQPEASICARQNWPNFDAACLRYSDGKQPARNIRAVGDQL
jgi:hypothetical protein